MSHHLLIVEDDATLAVLLRDGFISEGYTVQVVGDGVAGLQHASNGSFDLIILDIMLPQLSGFDLCRQLRRAGHDAPVIMLTARGQEVDKVLGLKLGADDYVTKPFSFLELFARAEAVLRRASRSDEAPDRVQFGDVAIDFISSTASKAGQPLSLSPREFHILRHLIAHRGNVVTRDQLLDAVWGYAGSPLTRTVDMHIANLRKKLEANLSKPQYIITHYGLGYQFVG